MVLVAAGFGAEANSGAACSAGHGTQRGVTPTGLAAFPVDAFLIIAAAIPASSTVVLAGLCVDADGGLGAGNRNGAPGAYCWLAGGACAFAVATGLSCGAGVEAVATVLIAGGDVFDAVCGLRCSREVFACFCGW